MYNLASSRCRDGVQLLGRPTFPGALLAATELDVKAGDRDELADAGRVDSGLVCDISKGSMAQHNASRLRDRSSRNKAPQ